MYFSVPLAGLAVLIAISSPAVADSQSDLEQCKFAGEISKADEHVAACDRALGDPKLSGPNRAVALSNRCGWWWGKKDPDRALPDCDEAIKLDPNLAAAHANRGNVYLSKADVDHAFTDFNEAIRLDPKSGWAYTARGDIYKNKGDFDHAMADFTESIRLDPGFALAHYFRGELYKRKGDLDHALPDLNDAIRLDPNYAMAYFTRGCVSYTMGNGPAALADFGDAIKLEADNAEFYFNRGVAYFIVGGHLADAEADFRKAAELNPKDAYAAIWLDLAAARTNTPSRLAEAAKQFDMTAWPAPVVRQFLGEMNAAQTVAAANDSDPKTKLGQTCEANFYGGEFALTKKKKKEALPLLKLAAHDCPRAFIESTAAISELIAQH
jgi:tetratricopeptide (TPR) repeat protein